MFNLLDMNIFDEVVSIEKLSKAFMSHHSVYLVERVLDCLRNFMETTKGDVR